jgi:transposase
MSDFRTATVSVGLDVHARSVHLTALRGEELLDERVLPNDLEAVERAVARWPGARCCYEAGPTGFGLYRYLRERGVACEVVAPGLVPSRPGERIKTDQRDSRKLARLHQAGLLEAIAVPSRELEALRDLVRAREDARLDRMRARHRLSKFMLRHGRPLPGKSWGVTRRNWLAAQRFDLAAQQQTLADYLHAVDLIDARVAGLERSLEQAAEHGPWASLVARLRCLRGVDTLTALGIIAEIGDFQRFRTAEQFMAFVGLVPSEHSSGESQRRGSITKAGNAHVRRLLIEAAWHARLRPAVGPTLSRRQRGQDPLVIERAWRAQTRLHRRWWRMAGRGKPHQKIVVAIARELAGFI